MTFRLRLDVERWQRHQEDFLALTGDVVPVVKGNGYGFGVPLLAERCARLGSPVVAVGTAAEAQQVRSRAAADVLVLNPLLPGEAGLLPDDGTIRTVARRDVLAEVERSAGDRRVVVEMAGPVQRFGLPWSKVRDLRSALSRVRCEGVALHLPPGGNGLAAARTALHRLQEAGIRVPALWVSHLSMDDLWRLRIEAGSTRVRLRSGTALWLGDPAAYEVTGLVVDTHAVRGGDPVGYRQSPARRSGTIVVVSGGTAHGVGLRAPAGHRTLPGRLRDLVGGVLDATGRGPSPFSYKGHRLVFADVPHMQVSMLLVPHGHPAPVVGERLRCGVRMTLSSFDEVEPVGGDGVRGAPPGAAAPQHAA